MTTRDDTGYSTSTVRRDLVAVLLMVLGTIGLLTIAWLADPLMFAALCCVVLIAAGAALGYHR